MKRDIPNSEPRELMNYIPASIKVVSIESMQSILALSDERYTTEFGDGGDI